MFGFVRPAGIAVAGLCLAICSLAGSAGESLKAEPPKQETLLETAKRLSGSKEQKDRVQALQSLKALGQPGKAEGDEALARYADLCMRFFAEGEKNALPEAKRAFTDLKEKSHSRWGIRGGIGLWRVAAAEGKRDEAIFGLDTFLSGQSQGDESVETAFYLGCLLGRNRDDLSQLRRARTALDYAAKLYGIRGLYYGGIVSLCDIQHEVRAANSRIWELEVGEDFLAYRQAETLRRVNKDYGNALKVYRGIIEKHPKGSYTEAAQLYAPLCLVELGKIDEATQELTTIYEKNKNGLYAGEALLELGRIQLERRLNPIEARKYFVLLNAWLERASMAEASKPDLGVTPAAKPLIMPPQCKRTTDRWGNGTLQPIAPGNLVNQLTCPWYLSDLDAQCAGFRGFLYFVEGKQQEALKCYEKLLDKDSGAKKAADDGGWNDYTRLKWGADHGYLFAYPCELASYNDAQKFAVLLADFYFVRERFEEAKRIYRRVLSEEFGKLTVVGRQYAHYAVGNCIYWMGDKKGAYREFLLVLEKREGSFTEDRATYSAGNVSVSIDDKAIRSQGKDLLVGLMNSGHTNEFVWKAWTAYGCALIEDGKCKEGLRLLKALPESAGEYRGIAAHYASWYERHGAGEDTK